MVFLGGWVSEGENGSREIDIWHKKARGNKPVREHVVKWFEIFAMDKKEATMGYIRRKYKWILEDTSISLQCYRGGRNSTGFIQIYEGVSLSVF